MGAIPASKTPRDPQLYQKAGKIKMHVDELIGKIQKEHAFMPTRDQLAKFAKEINDLIMGNRPGIRSIETHLKAAIIDLTEVPEMNPMMQRISYLTALKDASMKIQLFLDCC